FSDRADDVADPDAAAQGDVVGGLDYRAVQHRIAVRQADLDDVGAAVQRRLDRGDAPVDGREAGGQVRDERSPVLLLRRGRAAGRARELPALCAPRPAASSSWPK